ncbi:MAG: DNA-directed RNA polymerase subunit alpha [Candidatus Buchananbacteria bacterium CG10_big_fil_rev_8_21_14_0_10_42_9]|uniref:DNA-directed RNA polymerase subunit alpha n=1 Tax=Candidatus Buchananbacteria bacterium CG10_big_fil_rev_8_21_14_0_10_42_9 TaxID=1974526 RepID=A0A2H0W0Z2_9BACT|nr:MAG: DNA-directed RNA polymerase subunit alpha [Candidatus Buchananbacteria bacterium CG10_big_fil_rev_8_21_14_0_10_42_9]
MEQIHFPDKIELNKGSNPNETIVNIEAFSPGYGTTIGNALRRILLSSLPGAAITSYKIEGVQHEFSAIDGVKEDIVEVLLNLKRVRFKKETDEPVKIELKVKGEKTITAKDFKCPADLEITNPDQHIMTLTDKNSSVEMSAVVENGRGYESTEEREGDLEIGSVAIDSLFSPIQNVGFTVENVRVGEKTNYDKLVMNIETDGSMDVKDALSQAIEILQSQFTTVNDLIRGKAMPSSQPKPASSGDESKKIEAAVAEAMSNADTAEAPKIDKTKTGGDKEN